MREKLLFCVGVIIGLSSIPLILIYGLLKADSLKGRTYGP